MTDRRNNEEIWDERADRYGSSFTRHPILWILGVIAALVVISQIAAFGCGWYNTGKEIVSPANVKEQYSKVIEDYVAMERQAETVCEAKQKKSTEKSPEFLETPGQAYATKYRQTEVDYDQRQHNFFKSELVGPKGYPHTAPTLEEMQAKVC
jgi:hypothetical protein